MTLLWDDLNARARGWTTHLLRPDELRELARLPDPGSLGLRFEHLGWLPAGAETAPPARLETAVRRVAGGRLTALARWAGPRTRALALIFDDLDRRSIRSIVRGAVAAAPASRRLADALPTPALPLRALEDLAGRERTADVAALLALWKHPLAGAVAALGTGAEPDLVRFEIGLAHGFARRALAAARAADRRLVPHVVQLIDLDNITTALLLAGEPIASHPPDPFVEGGNPALRARCAAAARAADPAQAARLLRESVPGAPLARLLLEQAGDPLRFESAALRLRLRLALTEARRDPLGPAVTLRYALRVRAEQQALQRIIWTLVLAGPPADFEPELELTG